MINFYDNILNKKQLETILALNDLLNVQPIYLAGGTALALKLQHRLSDDFDFFFHKKINLNKILNDIKEIFPNETKLQKLTEDTLNIFINDIKFQFLQDFYGTIYDFENSDIGINIASDLDIALMKILAIMNRGTKKDFIDLYFLMNKFNLELIMDSINKKYTELDKDNIHLLHSLIYFKDADKDPDPIMLKKMDWNEIKKYITGEVNNYIKKQPG